MNSRDSFFVVGTGTDIGKTYISGLFFKALKNSKATYYKPIQSGSIDGIAPDVLSVCSFAGVEYSEEMCSYNLIEPVSPHLSAEIDKVEIDFERILKKIGKKRLNNRYLIVEGAGGVCVPLNRDGYMYSDLIKKSKLPVILVADTKVGTINHTLATLSYLKAEKIPVLGVVFNRFKNEYFEKDNIDMLVSLAKIDNYLIVDEGETDIDLEKLKTFLNYKSISQLQKKDLEYIFHPCSQMKDYEKLPPMVIKKGKGVYLIDENGKRYMDCVSSWWVNLFGHCNERINKALNRQLESLEHTIFANFTHEPAIELGERLIEVVPKGLKKLIFSENGSSAVEIALKISFQYHQEKGNTKRKKFVSLKNAYHGETLGALGVTDVNLFTELYKPLIKEALKVEGPDCYRCSWNKKPVNCEAECFIHMQELLEENGDEIAGVIIEPMVQGAAGMNMYSPKYLKKLRALTIEKGVHFIADEIAVGFGRTGKMFACEHADISPDIMCVGKGLTAGYFPMALTLITDEIYNTFYKDYLEGGAFLHSHSYSGNPLGCSVAVETLKIFKEEDILKEVEKKAQYLEKKAREIFENHKNIGEYRQIGFIGALELVKDKEKKERFKSYERATYEIYKIGLEKGIIIRPLGDVVYFMPPYTIELDEIDFMLEKCLESIEEYLIKRKNMEVNNKFINSFVGFEV